jgi:carboxylesterase
MPWLDRQKEKSYPHNPDGLIIGAEPFEFGKGSHALLFIHGWTSSPRELRSLAQTLDQDFFCKAILLKGHGRYPEALENTAWEDYYQQVVDVFCDLKSKYSKVSLVGCSYGAVLALHAAANQPVTNLVLLSPFIKSVESYLKVIPNSSLIRYLPPFVKKLRKRISSTINDAQAGREHIAYHIMPVRPLKSVMKSIRRLTPLLPHIKCPVLMMHSKGDKTSQFEGSREIYELLGSPDKSLVVLSQSNHIITLDNERDKVESTVKDWLVKRR